MIGQTISHYNILEKLGEGGMGVVYNAHDTLLKRTVALKFLPPDLTRDEEAKTRFAHEAQAASALQHPNICTIHDIDETTDKQLFIVMDCYEGDTLKQKIEGGPLPIDKAIGIATQVAQGLAKAHESGIIHRDIKPANIMTGKDGIAQIVDFGLAKLSGQTMLTKSGSTVGTLAYMSPEQARGEKVDVRTDIWSLGVVIYEMITGRLPFKSEYNEAIVYLILNENPPPLTSLRSDVTMDLERIVNKCLEKNRQKRYQHIDELLVDLRQIKEKASAPQLPAPRKLVPTGKYLRWLLIGSAAVIVVAASILLFPLQGTRSTTIGSIAVVPFENLSGDSEPV